MIRRLIILLLIVGCVFADTIVVKQEKKDKDGFTITYNSERTGNFEGILKTKVYLRDSKGKLNELMTALKEVGCNSAEKLKARKIFKNYLDGKAEITNPL